MVSVNLAKLGPMDTLLTAHYGKRCSTCVLAHFCLPAGIATEDVPKVDVMVKDRMHLKKGEYLYRQGEEFSSIFSVRFGSIMTEYFLANGRHQVMGFHLPGEVFGLDGIGDRFYQSDAITLEESEVCTIPFAGFQTLASQIPALQSQFNRILSRELTQDRRHLLNLGSLHAIERLAGFVINLSLRLAVRGHEDRQFILPMSRAEIASYLGVKIETISRTFTRFSDAGLIRIQQRHITLVDMGGLYEIASQAKPSYLCLSEAA